MKPFHGLRRASYGAILADPPWPFRIWAGNDATPHRTDEDHYLVMSIEKLKSLPVSKLSLPDCALFLWVVDAQLPACIEVGQAWGFEYKTRAFEWLKTKKAVEIDDNRGYAEVDFGIGMGYWTRKQTESCLLFTRGKPGRLNADVRQIIAAPRRQHSRKPDETYNRIERLVAGPYCELFARYHRAGWEGWGDDYL